MRSHRVWIGILAPLAILMLSSWAASQRPQGQVVPHNQDRAPGPALSPAEAMQKMTVPEGFAVELVAGEPDIVNPVAMTFDEKGRIWITESLEYPRSSAGPGRDRIKVLESTRGDGVYDKISIFADGLNIPSGIAVGHGGVWVANAPDILFLQDTDGDGKADRKEVVVTGFGRSDTHELPNSLTWGPDGWLYGLNGVFNHSHVHYRGKDYRFTCAMFRIHPRTRDFEIFCEGTSNPWGIAFDTEGSAFVSACVIDHLWHLTETGYYHRQGGPYPPFTWKLDSIVKHKHQKAAYCGLHFFDSEAYPPEYREKLYMGNIHGGCINVDALQRDGSTYSAVPAPDFLTANDPWFMPVAQKTGPDGCLYILDWYDRYHCYQDARRDPNGIDRNRGRLYRIRYRNTPRAGQFDLTQESDDQLIRRLHSPNILFRDLAQRLLCERLSQNSPRPLGGEGKSPLSPKGRGEFSARSKLQALVLDETAPRKPRMHALWTLIGTGTLEPEFHHKLLAHTDAGYRAWGVRAAGNYRRVDTTIRDKVRLLAHDPSPQVVLQVAIAAPKLEGVEPMPLLLEALAGGGQDRLISPIVWQNLHPLLETQGDQFLGLVAKTPLTQTSPLARLLPRALERILAIRGPGLEMLARSIKNLTPRTDVDPQVTAQCLEVLASKVQTGEINGSHQKELAEQLLPDLHKVLVERREPVLTLGAALLLTSLKDDAGYETVRQCFASSKQSSETRLQALSALIAARDPAVRGILEKILANPGLHAAEFRRQMLASLGKLDDPGIASLVLAHYAALEPELKPAVIELLTGRAAWGKELLAAVAEKKVSASALNVNQVRKLLAMKDPALRQQVAAQWGTLRENRDPDREKLVATMRDFVRTHRGDPVAGMSVFKNVCGQCHKIHGDGQDVGPDITANGRSDFDQLLSNVFDPNLVISAAYQATTVVTTAGQTVTGLLVEDNAQRVILKQQGGKLETIARGDIETVQVSKVSLMPEGLEKQLKPQELADLFAFLILDKPPSDPTARPIKGAPRRP